MVWNKDTGKKRDYISLALVVLIAIGLALIIAIMFGGIVAYEVFTIFGASFETSLVIGLIAGLIGGVVTGWHFIEDFA